MKDLKIYGALALVGAFLLFKIGRLLNGFFGNDGGIAKVAEMTRATKNIFASVHVNDSNINAEVKSISERLWLLLEPAQRCKSDEIISLLGPLNVDELKAVYKEFGVKLVPEIKFGFGFENRTADLIGILKDELLNFNPLDWNGLDRVKALFKGTGLWE